MPLLRGQKKKWLRQDRFEHNTTQFFDRRRVLHSDGPNHINHRVPRVHLELTTKMLNVFPQKNHSRLLLSGSGESVSDFGMDRIFSSNVTEVNPTRVVGTQ
jgi:hypothetical protein